MRGVGSGKITVEAIVKRLLPEEIRQQKEEAEEVLVVEESTSRGARGDAIVIDGINDMMVRISHCCMPVPGDDVMGFITAGRGITVHKVNCSNFKNTDPDRHVAVEWASSNKISHRASVLVIAQDQKGFLATLSGSISSDDGNILNVDAQNSDGIMVQIRVLVEITNRSHLEKMLQHIRQLSGVIEARRE